MSVQFTDAAELAGLTERHFRRLLTGDDPPPRSADGTCPARELGEWLKRRALSGVSVGDDGTVYNYEAERARLTHEQADKVSLEVSELRADLVRMSVVEAYWADLGASLRSKLVSIPSKLSALVADPILRAKFHAQSEALIYEGLAEIQKDAVPAAVRGRADRSRGGDVPFIASPAAETDA